MRALRNLKNETIVSLVLSSELNHDDAIREFMIRYGVEESVIVANGADREKIKENKELYDGFLETVRQHRIRVMLNESKRS